MTEKLLIGIDLGGTTAKIAFVTEEGKIVHNWELPTDTSNNGVNIVKNIAKSVEEKMAEMGLSKADFSGCAIGSPGPIDEKDGSILGAVNLGWGHYPLKAEIEKYIGLPAEVANDANIAALGEMWLGAGRGCENIVMVTLGTGVGGGIIINGKILNGVNGAGGEVGHMQIEMEDGYACNCGKTGCLETLVSATGITRLGTLAASENPSSKLNDYDELSAKIIFETAAEGDAIAQVVVEDVAAYLGATIANIGNILNPERIVIGGGVSKAGDALLNPTKEYFKKYAFSAVADSTEIVIAELGNDAGVIGAAYLAKKN